MLAFLIVFLALCHGALSILPEVTEEELRLLPAEYRTNVKPRLHASPPRVTNTRVGLKHLYVDNHGRIHSSPQSSHTITISATNSVGKTAFRKAATIIALMTRHMPSTVFNNVATRGHGVGIFTDPEKITVFPEFAYLKSPPECSGHKCSGSVCSRTCYSDGRKYEDMHGLTNSISAVVDDNVLCNAHDPHHHMENILVHEFAHQVYNYMPSEYRNKLNYIFNHDKQHHTWQDKTYATSNSHEFWAEASAAFFRASVRPHVTSATGGMNICNFQHVCSNEAENREWLKKHDAPLYNLLAKVYTNNHPTIPSGLKVCQ